MTAIVRPPAPVPAGPALQADGRRPIESIWEARPGVPAASVRGGRLPADLAARFGARLEIPVRTEPPTIAVNFVSTLDGVVAFDRAGATGGREISGGFEPDRFVMGLMRATADAVLVGAGTVRASRTHAWTPARVHPASAAAFAGWRRDLGLTSAAPTTVVVSASGDLERGQLDLTDPDVSFVVATTANGARQLRSRWPSDRVEVVPIADGRRLPIDAVLGLLRERGYGLVLSEGGPTLFAELLAARAVDELFLTVAPQLAGRFSGNDRLSLVEGVSFVPGLAPWATLRSVMRSDDHLFLRYNLADRGREGVS
jgi:riboflavin biosynthesis pyrimidine reductase